MLRWTLAATLAMGLAVTAGCRLGGNSSGRGEAGNYVGPYTVEVYDQDSGDAIRGAVVEWEFYFASDRFDALKRHRLGVETTDGEGVAEIAKIEIGPKDEFSELELVITKAGYLEARRTVKPGGLFTSNAIVFRLTRIKPLIPSH